LIPSGEPLDTHVALLENFSAIVTNVAMPVQGSFAYNGSRLDSLLLDFLHAENDGIDHSALGILWESSGKPRANARPQE